MKRIILSVLFLLCMVSSFGQTPEEDVVYQFGDNLRNWCSTKNINYRSRAQKQCTDACRVKDKIMEDFVASSGLNTKDYVVPNYLNCFQDAMGKGGVSFLMSNIKTISNNEQAYVSSYGTSSIKQEEKHSKNYTTIACDISVNGGSMNYQIKDLYYIHKDKIVKITPYEEIIDEKTGKKKVKVDFSDIIDEITFGASYNYGKNWPVGLSVNYSYSMFMISADVGVNLDKDKLYKHSLEMTDVMNFNKEDIEYDPYFFFTITPSFYMKYFSVGCGAGFMYMKGTKYIATSTSKPYNNNGVSSSNIISSSMSTTENCSKVKFMLRPSLKGFIPLNDDMFLSLSVSYDCAFGYKEKNGLSFGVGLQFNVDW